MRSQTKELPQSSDVRGHMERMHLVHFDRIGLDSLPEDNVP